MFVRAREGEGASLGIGKEISISGQHCSVEYFDAPVSKPIVLDLYIAAIWGAVIGALGALKRPKPLYRWWATGSLANRGPF